MIDLLIKGGKVVSASESVAADVAVVGEQIAAVVAPGLLDNIPARQVVEAQGKLVMPGAIDPHVHFRLGFPPVLTQDYTHGSIAAAYAGTTTVIDFAFQSDEQPPMAAVEQKLGEMEGKMAVDYAAHCILSGPKLSHKQIADIKQVIDFGIPSLKMFMIYFNWWSGDGALYHMFKELAEHGGMGIVHAENGSLKDYLAQKLIDEGTTHGKYVEWTRPAICEEEATRRALFWAERAGSPLYVFHMTARESLQALFEARAKGLPMYGETCHNYLVWTNDDVMNRPNGLRYINFPPARYAEDREALWNAVAKNMIVVSSDDFSVNAEVRDQMGESLPEPQGGHAGLEVHNAVIFSEGVSKGRITENRFVDAVSTRIAKIFGLYPRKGVIAPGSDADIMIFDPEQEKTIRLEELHTVNYSIWDGFKVKGVPVMTISRGQILVENGKYLGRPGHGRFQKRRISSDVLQRPI